MKKGWVLVIEDGGLPVRGPVKWWRSLTSRWPIDTTCERDEAGESGEGVRCIFEMVGLGCGDVGLVWESWRARCLAAESIYAEAEGVVLSRRWRRKEEGRGSERVDAALCWTLVRHSHLPELRGWRMGARKDKGAPVRCTAVRVKDGRKRGAETTGPKARRNWERNEA